MMSGQQTVLAALLQAKGMQRYGTFRAAYDKAARALDRTLAAGPPSRAQFHRWLTGELRGLPRTDHCRVLEHMLPGYQARQLFQPGAPGDIPRPALAAADRRGAAETAVPGAHLADVVAVYPSRSDFTAKVQPQALLGDARRIRAAGLSLNMICQQLPDRLLRELVLAGTSLTCLFLDPDGTAIKAREQEEQFPPGRLSTLTRLNIETLARLRDRLPPDAQERIQLAVYDETIRFNIIIADDRACVVQPYLPQARGVDSPTLLIRPGGAPGGLYPVFEQVYEAIHERSKPL